LLLGYFQITAIPLSKKATQKEYEVNNTVAIHQLQNLYVMITREDDQRLLYLEAHGNSINERPGYPKLVLKEPGQDDRDDLLEFDMVIRTDERHSKGDQQYELKVVVDVKELPFEPKWIKVNAAYNADIAQVREIGFGTSG
jgi:hypothetical protein